MIITPTHDLNIDAYHDADSSILYNYKEYNDIIFVQSRTGFVINVDGCPVLWNSQIQSETAMSTMPLQVIALAACCRELIPRIAMVGEMVASVGFTQLKNSKMHVCINEDNAGAFILAQTLPTQLTPAIKHYVVKTHWFRERCIDLVIVIKKISTAEQLGDKCTKCLPVATFQYLRKNLMGW